MPEEKETEKAKMIRSAGLLDPVKPTVKPGYKTTEFHAAAATIATGILLALGVAPASPWVKVAGMFAAAAASIAYAWARAKVKTSPLWRR